MKIDSKRSDGIKLTQLSQESVADDIPAEKHDNEQTKIMAKNSYVKFYRSPFSPTAVHN